RRRSLLPHPRLERPRHLRALRRRCGCRSARRRKKPGVHASVLRADGSYADILSVPGNVCGGAIVGTPFLKMDGPAVVTFAVRVLDESARETLAAAKMALEDVDWLIPHQANVRILEAT